MGIQVVCPWVFTIKYKSDGTIEQYKERLIAKGYTQTYGLDCRETFVPVAKINTLQILLSLAANFGCNLFQIDVKNAFLHGDLAEEVYMEIPPSSQSKEWMVCRLKMTLYGLKQSPRARFVRLTKVMTNYLGNNQETKASRGVNIMLVYADDMIISGNDIKGIQELKQRLLRV